MGNGIIGKIIYFWAFMLGVVVFGKVFGFLGDTRQSVYILVGAALIFIVWNVFRALGKKKRS